MTAHKSTYRCQYRDSPNDLICNHVASMECIDHGCAAKLCRKHFQAYRKQAKEQPSKVMHVHFDQYEDIPVDSSTGTTSNTTVSNQDNNDNRREEAVQYDNDILSDNDEDGYCTANIDLFKEQNNEDFIVDPVVDGEDDNTTTSSNESMSIDNSSLSDHDEDIPMTTAGKKGADLTLKAKERNDTIHLMVVINAEGGCLIRRGKVLQHTLKEKGFLQRILATHGESIPLLFPEAMMFPSIFWLQLPGDLAPMGSLPSSLWTDEKRASKFNFAGVVSHIQSRVKNNQLLCSTDPRFLTLCNDIQSNIRLRGKNSNLVLRRGYETLYGENSEIKITDNYEMRCNQYACDVVDSRRSVNAMATIGRYYRFGIFHTTTLNQQSHPGPKEITAFLKYEENRIRFNEYPEDPEKADEYCEALHQAAAIHIYRSYIKVVEDMIDWIVNSEEAPLTEIQSYFIVRENQEETLKVCGIFPHFHMCFCLKANIHDPTVLHEVRQKIRCSQETLLDKNDIRYLLLNGIIENIGGNDGAMEIKGLAGTILVHICEAARHRCEITGRDGKKYCKNVHYGIQNPNLHEYGYNEFPVKFYNEEAKQLFLRLHFIEQNEADGSITAIDNRLRSGIHVYPTNRMQHFQPVANLLFAIFQSSMNTRICDHSMSQRYLCNYCGRVDKRAYSHISPNQKTGSPEVEIEVIANTKITSNRIADEKRLKAEAKSKGKIKGSIIGLTQVFGHLLQSKEVYCSETFVSIPSVPLEDRCGVKRSPTLEFDNAADTENFVYHGNAVGMEDVAAMPDSVNGRKRLNLPPWRQFTSSEETILRDQLCAAVSIDNLTWYSIRPPELRFIENSRDYIQCFFWKKMTKKITHIPGTVKKTRTEFELNHCLFSECPWIDGIERQIYIRRAGLNDIIRKYQYQMPIEMKKILCRLNYEIHSVLHDDYDLELDPDLLGFDKTKFLHKDDEFTKKLPLCVISPIKPTRSNKFLIHVILSMGIFSNEVDLWSEGTSIADIFYNAKLIPNQPSDQSPPTQADVDLVLFKYIDEQLLHLPVAMFTIHRYALDAQYILRKAIMTNSIPDMGIPGYLYTTLYRSAEIECEEYLASLKKSIVEKLIHILPHNEESNPTVEDFLTATKAQPLDWNPVFIQLDEQSDQSFHEQKAIFNLLRTKIDSYINNGTCISKRGTILHGPPGAGKTFIQSMAILYAISQGLCSITTSLAARRSHQLGGKHIAEIFHIINKSKSQGAGGRSFDTTSHNTDDTLGRIYRHPLTLNLLHTLEVIGLDEGGLETSEFMSTLDMIVRTIRSSPDYLGSMLMMITLDINQTAPIDRSKHPILSSPNIITSFDIVDFQGFVRCRGDIPQQQLIRLFQKGTIDQHWTPQDVETFSNIIKNNCNFVKDWKDKSITMDTICTFGKHQAVNMSEKLFIERHITNSKIPMVTAKATDEQSIRSPLDNAWYPPSSRTIKKLSHDCKMQETIYLYENAIVEMTFNNGKNWDQGQIAIVRHIPSQNEIDDWSSLTIFLGGENENVPPSNYQTLTDEQLIELGWKRHMVHKHTSETVTVSAELIGRRTQYPLRSRDACTIHKIIGDTLFKGATQISADRNSPYYIWERGLVVVLLTRFRSLKDLTFVGNEEEVVKVLLETLNKPTEYYEFCKKILDNVAIRFPLEDTLNEHDHTAEFGTTSSSHNQDTVSIQRSQHTPPTITLTLYPFRPIDYPLPSKRATPTGFVYLLMSLIDRNCIYIGQTENLKKRFQQHNTGKLKNIADPSLKPWTLLLFYTGFLNPRERKHFEQQWIYKRNWQRKNYGESHLTLSSIIDIGNSLCIEHNNEPTTDNQIICHKCFLDDIVSEESTGAE